MTKVSVIVLLIADFIAAMYAVPVPREIDWAALRAKVDEIQIDNLNSNFAKLIAVANKDNPDACVGVICFAYVVNRYDIDKIRFWTRELEFDADGHKTTRESVSICLSQVRRHLGILVGRELPPYLAQLSEPAAQKVKTYFEKIHRSLDQSQGELYAILMEGQEPGKQ